MRKTAYSIIGFYEIRLKTINSLNENERNKYLKNELEFIKKRMPNTYMNYFSKSDDFIAENVIFNIVDKKIIINMDEDDESKQIFNESFFNQSEDFKFLHGLLIYLKDESGVKIINP